MNDVWTIVANHHVKASCCSTSRFQRCRENLERYIGYVSAFPAAVAYVDRSVFELMNSA